MERSLFRFILRFSLKQQLLILALTAASWPILYMTLELPKRIVNEALGGRSGWARGIVGDAMDPVTFLMALAFAFLAFVSLHGALKYVLNVYAGRLGEQMLRRLRYQLYASVLRFPLPHFKKVSQGEIIPMITAETEPVGGFIGEAFSTPAFQGGMLLVYLVFIFVQDIWLGFAAVALYPVQIWWIPKLQGKVNRLAKERVRTVRQLSDKIGESVMGITEIRSNDATRFERADVSTRLGKIYVIRYEIFRRKFAIKFINNFLAQLTPFFFYSIGGYLVLRTIQTGDPSGLTLGALVAVLAAYKDLASPWKELLNYYQQVEDVRIKYEQVVEQFGPPGMVDAASQDADPDPALATAGALVGATLAGANLTYSEDGRVKSVEGANFSLRLDRHTAIVGGGGSGKEELLLMLARLLEPSGGSLSLNGARLQQIPDSVIGRRMAYVGSTPFLFTTTVRDNLFYGLKHRAPGAADGRDAAAERRRFVADAEASGNLADDHRADWIDYAAAGAADRAALEQRGLQLLEAVDMADDIYNLGLRGIIDPAAHAALAAAILEARSALRAKLVREGQDALVEPFDAARYNENATLAENLLFGTPRDDRISLDRLARTPYVLEVLEKSSLADDLLGAGRQVADTMVELFAGLEPGNALFEQYSFISADDLPEYQAILARTANQQPGQYRAEDRERLLSLPFRLISARHRLGVVNEAIKGKVLAARRLFAAELPPALNGAIELFDSARYNGAATLLDNILFGKIAYGQAQAQNKVNRLVSDVLGELGFRDDVMTAGLDFHVGVAGARLSAAQRQKLALARALLKRPDALVLFEALSALDGASQSKVLASLKREMQGRGLVWGLQRPSLAKHFDEVWVMRGGRIVEHGAFDELNRPGTALAELVQSS
jgi:ABC-type multidrug transport system fused ATPase/permease subunit